MAQETEWCFCHKLPTIHRRNAGRVTRCQRCEGELLVVRGTGETYRLAFPPIEGGNARRRRLAILGAGSLAALICVILPVVLLGRGRSPEPGGEALTQAQDIPVPSPRPIDQPPTLAFSELPIANPQLDAEPDNAFGLSRTKPEPTATDPVAWTKASPVGQEAAGVVDKEFVYSTKNTYSSPPWTDSARTEEQLSLKLLKRVPEVALHEAAKTPKNPKEAKAEITKQTQAIAKQIADKPSAFVDELIEKRSDLAGLPWRPGEEWQLPRASALALAKMSDAIRRAIPGAALIRGTAAGSYYQDLGRVDLFWSAVARNAKYEEPTAFNTLAQVLCAEDALYRLSLVERLSDIQHGGTSVVIAQRAVFDLHADVRTTSIELLKGRSGKDYVPVLLNGLQHPWSVAAQNAAEALVKLEAVDAVPDLIDLWMGPDPAVPYVENIKGKETPVVRELVRVNHLRNCLLCHAPATSTSKDFKAPIPTPGERLPEIYYYGGTRDPNAVRPDVTYIKQDFSVMHPVKDPGAWPALQRFDYLVRTRPLNASEREAFERQLKAAQSPFMSEHRQAIFYALCALTGQNAE
jgi:hypothetical protein